MRRIERFFEPLKDFVSCAAVLVEKSVSSKSGHVQWFRDSGLMQWIRQREAISVGRKAEAWE
jgi:hypothetical protein